MNTKYLRKRQRAIHANGTKPQPAPPLQSRALKTRPKEDWFRFDSAEKLFMFFTEGEASTFAEESLWCEYFNITVCEGPTGPSHI